jgi:DNA-binding IclR family transcriptional regulator
VKASQTRISSTAALAGGSEPVRATGANSTADKALDILLLFSLERPLWTMQEIADHFDMPRTTTYRYIASLKTRALLVENNSGSWHLGPMLFPLARAAKASYSILSVAAPFLQQLNDVFGEAVTLYERRGLESIALERLETHHRVKLLYSRGHMLPWPGAASAKVLLAFAPAPIQEELFAQMTPTRYTPQTITSMKELKSTIRKIVQDGYAYSDQERDEGIRAIAAPIFERSDARYCVTTSGPSFRMTDDKLPKMIRTVRETAAAISSELKKLDY